MSTAVDTFGIALPPEWIRFPLDEDREFEDFVRVQRERLEREAHLSKTARRQYELLMRAIRADCERGNVRMVASMLDAIEVDGADAELLAAACTIAVLDRVEMGSEVPLTASTMVVALSREPRHQDDGVEITNLEPPTLVRLDVGQAVKVVRVHTFPPPQAGMDRPKIFVQHFLVPINDGDDAVVVSFTSPTIHHSRALSGLFDKMMSTFRVFAGDEPTDPVSNGAQGQ